MDSDEMLEIGELLNDCPGFGELEFEACASVADNSTLCLHSGDWLGIVNLSLLYSTSLNLFIKK